MSRILEIVEATGENNRLTVTPTRITIKLLPNHENDKHKLIEVSKKIADQIVYPHSLRGIIGGDNATIAMKKDRVTVFTFDQKGELV